MVLLTPKFLKKNRTVHVSHRGVTAFGGVALQKLC